MYSTTFGFILFLLAMWGIYHVLAPLADITSRNAGQRPPGPGLSAVEFPEQTLVIAKDQPQYRPLPAYIDQGPQGYVVTCWRLNARERLKLLFTGRLWASTLTFQQPLQPLQFSVHKSDLLRETEQNV